MIIRLSRWRDKQDIMRAAAQRKDLAWEGQRFLAYQDFSAEDSQRRAQYNDLKKPLRKAGVRFGVVHPATLIVTTDEQKFTYSSREDAEKDLRQRLPRFFDA